MSPTCARVLLAAAIGLFAPLAASAQQPLVMYDDFSSRHLDVGQFFRGHRWLPYEYTIRFANRANLGPNGQNDRREDIFTRNPSFSTSNLSARRRIVGGQLQLSLESSGGVHPDPNVEPGHGRAGVMGTGRFQGNDNILQAKVTPMVADAPACRGTGESHVRAQLIATLLGRYDGPSPLYATLSLERSSFGGDRIYAVLSQRNPDGIIEVLRSVVFTRTWTLGSPHTLTINYEPDSDEPANSRLIFTVAGGGMPAERRVIRRVPPDTGFDTSPYFDLRVVTTPANCPAAGDAPAERVRVSIDARFDNVRIGDSTAGE